MYIANRYWCLVGTYFPALKELLLEHNILLVRFLMLIFQDIRLYLFALHINSICLPTKFEQQSPIYLFTIVYCFGVLRIY